MADDVASLEAKFKRLNEILTETEERISKSGLTLQDFERIAKESGKSVEDVARAASKLGAEIGKHSDEAQKKASDTADKAASIFSKGTGIDLGKFKEIGEGFGLVNNHALTATQRMGALAGTLGMVAGVAGTVVSAAHSIYTAIGEATAAANAKRQALIGLAGGYEEIKRVSGGVASEQQAFANTLAMSTAGLSSNTASVAAATQAARRYADTYGGDAQQAFQTFMSAIQSGDRNVLQRFGVTLDHNRGSVENLSRAISQISRQEPPVKDGWSALVDDLTDNVTDLKNAWLDSLNPMSGYRRHQAEIDAATALLNRTTDEAINAVRRNREETDRAAIIQTQMIEQINQGAAAYRNMATAANIAAKSHEDLGRKMNDVESVLERLGHARNEATRRRTQRREDRVIRSQLRREGFSAADIGGGGGGFSRDQADQLRVQIEDHIMQLERMGVAVENFHRRRHESLEHFLKRQEKSLSKMIQHESRMRAAMDYVFDSMATRPANTDAQNAVFDQMLAGLQGKQSAFASEAAVAERKADTDAARAHSASLIDALDDTDRLARQSQLLSDQLRNGHTTLSDARQRIIDLGERIAEGSEKNVDANLKEQESIRAVIAAEQERLRVLERAADYSAQFADATKQAFHLQETTAQGAAGVFNSTVGTMTGAFKTHLAAVIQGRETIGEALRAIAQETLTALAVESAVQALFETAKGIAKAATSYGMDPTATGHFVAAGIYAAVATAAGGAAYGLSTMAPKTSAGAGMSAGGSQGPARAGPSSTAGGQGGPTYVFNVNGTLTREDAQDAIVRALDEAGERGVRTRHAA
jgi:hypothetical protein